MKERNFGQEEKEKRKEKKEKEKKKKRKRKKRKEKERRKRTFARGLVKRCEGKERKERWRFID